MIIPSIASANTMRLADELKRLPDNRPLHIDIEDGNVTPDITFGMKTVKGIAKEYVGQKDVHLFVTEPYKYINELRQCDLWGISFQIETDRYPLRIINGIKDLGMKAGCGLDIRTPVDCLLDIADNLDYCIIMTAEPDGKGMVFYRPVLRKIKRARDLLPPHVKLWVDGGITESVLPDVAAAGADHAVMGRAAFVKEMTADKFSLLDKIFDEERGL